MQRSTFAVRSPGGFTHANPRLRRRDQIKGSPDGRRAVPCRRPQNVNRKALRALLLPGQERLHFNNESDARRKKILATISAFQLLVDLYRTQRNDVGARQRCLEAIVRDIAADAERLVVERDEGALDYDRRAMHEACHRYGCIGLRRELLVPKADPLLWIPDAVAWSWMKGGDWRRRVSPYCQLRPI
jgi:hypothetical protein